MKTSAHKAHGATLDLLFSLHKRFETKLLAFVDWLWIVLLAIAIVVVLVVVDLLLSQYVNAWVAQFVSVIGSHEICYIYLYTNL